MKPNFYINETGILNSKNNKFLVYLNSFVSELFLEIDYISITRTIHNFIYNLSEIILGINLSNPNIEQFDYSKIKLFYKNLLNFLKQ